MHNGAIVICTHCNHPLAKHCTGGVEHANFGPSGSSSGVPPRAIVICGSAHCNEPLCTCIAFCVAGSNSVYAQPQGQPRWLRLL